MESRGIVGGADGVDATARDVGVFSRFHHRQSQTVFADVETTVVHVHLTAGGEEILKKEEKEVKEEVKDKEE